ncbi:hypothetical protein [Alkalicoccobacillus murimartini]|uniref:Uncharacterized protein n=1 Tax=Alkalicoccobacillus murimartini TaxID=171685 RepID=A0ABT9YMX0_9BACI|nr:hypothetical protein [Alkalicoccobacillus murimartini]MDQ0208830.1 hypothetical protein [Alkalicoccobacillus murimartini]
MALYLLPIIPIGGLYVLVFALNGVLDTLFGLEPSIKKWALSSAIITIIIFMVFYLLSILTGEQAIY